MTDATTADEKQDETRDDQEGGQPPIDEGELADMEAVAGEVEADLEDDQDDSADQDTPDDVDDIEMDPDSSTSIGDVYCNVLGMGAAVVKDEYGSGLEGDRKDELDAYADLARDLEIDEAVDDLLEEHGGPDSLSPGQTVLVMSVVWAGMVAMDEPEIIEGLADGGPA